jgi:hypothetical protein
MKQTMTMIDMKARMTAKMTKNSPVLRRDSVGAEGEKKH